MILNVIDYGLGLTTLSQSNLLKLGRVQNEAMRVILGTTKDTPIEAMRCLLGVIPVETKTQGGASQRRIPRIHSTMLSKKKGVQTGKRQVMDGPRQNNQEWVCTV